MGWTSITANTSWQDLTVAQQVVTAFNARVATMTAAEKTATGVDTLYSGGLDGDDTVFDVVYALQDGIEKLHTLFADPAGTLTGSTSYPANYASAQALLTAAGLDETGGWRRIAEGGTQPASWTTYDAAGWSYGKITDKDLAGPWLWIDLQKALDAMKRRIFTISGEVTGRLSATGYEIPAPYADADLSPPSTAIAFGAVEGEDWTALTSSLIQANKAGGTVPNGDNWDAFYLFYANNTTDWYCSLTLAGLGSLSKTVKMLGKVRIYHSVTDTGWTGAGDMGTGWDYSTADDFDTTANVVLIDSKTSSSTSVTFLNLPQFGVWTNWSGFANHIPWPEVGSDPYEWHENLLLLQTFVRRFVVDFAFDP